MAATAAKRKTGKKPAEDYRDWPIMAQIGAAIEGCDLPPGKYPVTEVFSGQIGVRDPKRDFEGEYLNNGEFDLLTGADLVDRIKAGQEPGVPLHVKITRALCEKLAADARGTGHDCVADLLAGKFLRAAACPAKSGDKSPHSKREIVEVPLEKIHRHPANRQIKEATCKGLAEDLRRRGLLSPIQVRLPGPVWDLPEGHYQIVFGERRTIAAQLAGWDTIAAEVVELSDAEVQQAIAAENGQREQLHDIERARRIAELCRPAAEGGGGLTQTQAAAVLGIDQSTASTLVQLLDLPADWQDLVIAGAIPGSHLRPLLKYKTCPRILQLLREDFDRSQSSEWKDQQAAWSTRETIENTVEEVVMSETRPVSKADLLPNEGSYAAPQRAIADADLPKLDVVEIPGAKGDPPIRRALALEAFQTLVHSQRKTKDKGKPAKDGKAKPAAPSAAEIKRRQAEEVKELTERLRRPEGLAEQGLRWAMAEAIRAILLRLPDGDWATNLVGEVLLDAARDSTGSGYLQTYVWRYLAWRLVGLDRPAKKDLRRNNSDGYRAHEWYGRYVRQVLDQSEQPELKSFRQRAYLARLLLFPSDDRITDKPRLCAWGTWPDRWPAIDAKLLADLAEDLQADIAATWQAARRAGPARRWLELVIAAHNTRHLRESLCRELGVEVDGGSKLDAMAEAILAQHAERGLAIPKVLRDG
jgi:ParB/RepB/Spo0J family partition protein